MPSLLVPSVPFYRNPQLRPGLAALVDFLMGRDCSSYAIGRIFDFVACNGTLEGSLVEQEDMADAEQVFVDALPAVDVKSPAWGSDDDLEDLDIRPIGGSGAPEDDSEPFTPTAEDWADYRAHFDRLEPLYGYE
jgi:hypothetical protein